MFPHERSLVKRLEGRPFALVGVDVGDDRDTVKREERDGTITWRSYWDEAGAVAGAWQAASFPTILLIDQHGVIRERFTGAPGAETLDRAIEQLVKEAENEPKTAVTVSATSRTNQ